VSAGTNPPPELAERGKKAYEKNLYSEALENFEAAKTGFQEARDVLNAAEMSNNLCVTLLQLDRNEEALQEVEPTPTLFLEHGDEARAAMAYGNLGLARDACGDRDGAIEALVEAVDRFQALGDEENLLHTAKVLSELRLRKGQAIEAVQTMQGGLEAQRGLGLKYRFLRKLLDIPSKILGR
jgi:tetratricopeptide (TPR) repeat protein